MFRKKKKKYLIYCIQLKVSRINAVKKNKLEKLLSIVNNIVVRWTDTGNVLLIVVFTDDYKKNLFRRPNDRIADKLKGFLYYGA